MKATVYKCFRMRINEKKFSLDFCSVSVPLRRGVTIQTDRRRLVTVKLDQRRIASQCSLKSEPNYTPRLVSNSYYIVC
jgi:hypothetical protein